MSLALKAQDNLLILINQRLPDTNPWLILNKGGKAGDRAREDCLFDRSPKPLTGCTIMPLYEYLCRKCDEKFSEVLTIKEHDSKKPQCPKCKSTDIEKIIEPFFAKTTSKTRGY